MQIGHDKVVSLLYELFNSEGELIEKTDAPIEYLHGGYDGIFTRVEEALEGKNAGDACDIYLQPLEAFGEYDAELVHVEERDKFPREVEVGMRFEGEAEATGEAMIYTVTDVTDEKVIVDGNHPLAGMALRFHCTIDAVRPATEEEIEHGHVHGAHGHHHH